METALHVGLGNAWPPACLPLPPAPGTYRFGRRPGLVTGPWLLALLKRVTRRPCGIPVPRLVPGRVPPMLWTGLGRPQLLLPAGLLGALDPGQRATLLAHELAHLRRRDHWVRRLEFVALGLYWWHPAAWLACRELREAEEQCCDAWVVAALPGAARRYATALVETLDFLAAAPAAPPLASGLGRV